MYSSHGERWSIGEEDSVVPGPVPVSAAAIVLSVSIQERTGRRVPVGDDGSTSDHWSNPNNLR